MARASAAGARTGRDDVVHTDGASEPPRRRQVTVAQRRGARSWGADWGEDGYYRIVRGDNHCGVANFAVHSVMKASAGRDAAQNA